MEVKLYTSHCPKCKVIEKKLAMKGIEYEEITDVKLMESKGIVSLPVLEVDGTVYKFTEANKWVSNYNK